MLLVGLAGCDRLFGFEPAVVGDGAIAVDTAADVTLDSDGSNVIGVCGALQFTTTTQIASGTSFSVSTGGIAVFDDGTELRQTTAAGGVGQPITFLATVAATLSKPRLAPSGDLFMLAVEGGVATIRRSTQISGVTWTVPSVVTINGLAINPGFSPGVPTTTIPRRMFVSDPSGGLLEGIEALDGTVDFSSTTMFGGLVGARDPALSTDGLTLVFVATGEGGLIAVYGVQRPALDQPFGIPQVLADNPDGAPGTEQLPALHPSCDRLYVGFDELRILEVI